MERRAHLRSTAARCSLSLAIAAGMAALSACSTDGYQGAVRQTEALQVDTVYLQRLDTFLADPGNFPYDPMEPLPGTDHWTALPVRAGPEIVIAADALANGRSYAEEMNSSAYMVWHDGRMADQWFAAGVDAATPLVSKSLSKPLTAITVGRAMALGHIRSLDQPISDFIPMAAGTDKADITVRHLLDMRSGMHDQSYSRDPASPFNLAYLGLDHGREIIENYPMLYEPGSTYSYANAPSDLVAMVIEGATGLRYGQFVSEHVLKPLGAQGGRIWVNREGGLAHSGCCTYLPAETFLRFAILLIEEGEWDGVRLLPEGFVNEMRLGTPQNPSFGLGVWLGEPYRHRRSFAAEGQPSPLVLHSEPFIDPELFMFDGNSNQLVAISPRHNLIVLRMGPTPPPPGADRREWDNAYLPNTLIRGLLPEGD
jgi:CubicO group peptidase (beta-lactamase class C family)